MRTASPFVATATRVNWLERFADDAGASTIEYGLILALVSILGITSLNILGNNAKATLSSAASFLP